MQSHHSLGALPKIGNTLWDVALFEREWMVCLSFSAAALKCAVRDNWIGWTFRHQFDRLNLVANNSRFLILPHCHHKNLASRVLSLCRRRIQQDWQDHFGYPLLLLETFVDWTRYQGTIYQASNWRFLGLTKGIRSGYSNTAGTPKNLRPAASAQYAQTAVSPFIECLLSNRSAKNEAKRRTNAITTRIEGLRHRIEVVLAIAAAATLYGMRGWQ